MAEQRARPETRTLLIRNGLFIPTICLATRAITLLFVAQLSVET